MSKRHLIFAAALLTGLLAACTAEQANTGTTVATPAETVTTTTAGAVVIPESSPPTTTTTTEPPSPYARPDWLGTRLLPLRPDEFGEVQPTPPEMVDRRFETPDVLSPPAGDEFEWSIQDVPMAVLLRSTWTPECPVHWTDLRYVTVSHWGFDQEFHTGEILVNARVAEDIVEVFRSLHENRFPIEEMRIIRLEEIDAHPTGDWNDTTSFVCRPAVGTGNWSQHAFGTAVDVNPFHNPYEKGDLVLPELASAYTDRSDLRPGMIVPGDEVVEAFAGIGWKWGGNWNSLKDYMHFSVSGG
jgi:hypothetical protein